MNETMVERVAKALHRLADSRSKPDCRVAWDDCLPAYHQMLLSEARAAIEAMREPTDAMEYAGATVADNIANVEAEICWRAMIDAALAAPEE